MPIRSDYRVVPSDQSGVIRFGAINESAVNQLPSFVSLIGGMPPIFDQGELGSCTGNAVAAAYQYDAMKEGIQVFPPSRLFIYYNERLLEGTVNQDAGAQIHDGIKVLATYGVCDEATWPYDITKFTVKPSDDAYQVAAVHKALSYYAVGVELEQVKAALAHGTPVVAGILLYSSFESDAVAASGFVPMPSPGEQCLGGHAVLFVGYDDTKQHLIVRNSWGADWGDHGYFYLPYSYLTADLCMDFWVVQTVK